eukprot:436325_1
MATDDSEIRKSWKKGSLVEVHSNSQKEWFQGAITEIYIKNQVEWLQVSYNGGYEKEMLRYDRNLRKSMYDPSQKSQQKINKKNQQRVLDEYAAKIIQLDEANGQKAILINIYEKKIEEQKILIGTIKKEASTYINDELLKQIMDLQNERNELKGKHQKELEKVQNEIMVYKHESQMKQSKIDQYLYQVKDSTQIIAHYQQATKQLDTTNEKKTIQMKDLLKQIAEQKTLIQSIKKEKIVLKKKNKEKTTQIKIVTALMNQLKEECKSLNDRLSLFENDRKEYEMTVNTLINTNTSIRKQNKKFKQLNIDTNNYKQWDVDEIVHWIISLNPQIYVRYE